MTVFVSVISHGHDSLVCSNVQLIRLSKLNGVVILICDNLNTESLKIWALENGIHYRASVRPRGFGANNNANYYYCRKFLGMKEQDYYCLCNPDLVVGPDAMQAFLEACHQQKIRIATLNLFQDISSGRYDLNIKRFPTLLDFFKGLVLGRNPAAYDKSLITHPRTVDWASGAFLLFRVDLYCELGGFDERFFMYLEDVDICRRALEQCGEPLWYFPQFKAVHLSQQANKRLFSEHFLWFIKSMLKYFWKYRFRKRPKNQDCSVGFQKR